MNKKRTNKNIEIKILIGLIIAFIAVLINGNISFAAENEGVVYDEMTFVRQSAALSRGQDKNNKVNLDTTQSVLNSYAGLKYKATVAEFSNDLLEVTFQKTSNKYLIEIDTGSVKEYDNLVTYYVDEGVVKTEEIQLNSSVLNPTTFTPTKSGWEFVGWREDTEAKNNVLSQKVMDGSKTTLYAVYKKTVTLTYDGNNAEASGSVANQTGTRIYNAAGNVLNPSIKLNANKFTRYGYKFTKWNLGDAGTTILLSENKTAKATWSKKVTIGDYVKYTPASYGNYTVDDAKSGYRGGDEKYKGSKVKGIKWRVLSINSSTGVVTIVSEPFGLNGVGTVGHNLEGSEGYSNGPTILNEICSNVLKLNTNVASSIRSLKPADIINLTKYTYDGTTYKYTYDGKTYGGYVYGQTYGSIKHSYYYYDIVKQIKSKDANQTGKLALVNDFFTRFSSNDGVGSIWLAGKAIKVKNSSGTSWDRGLRIIYDGKVTHYNQYQDNDSGNYSDRNVCAVVTLKEGVNFKSYSSSSGWTIE